MVFLKGNTYVLPVKLKQKDGSDIDITTVAKAQFVFGNIEKFYGTEDGDVEFNEDSGAFIVRLSEQDTLDLESGVVEWQARVMFNDGSVNGTIPKVEYLYNSTTDTAITNIK